MHHLFQRLFALILTLSASISVHALEESYSYDPAGRLSTITRSDGHITRFTYDSQGNLVAVRPIRHLLPPEIASVTPDTVRAGDSETIQLGGLNLSDATVIPQGDGFSVTGLVAEAGTLSFLLSAADDADTGEQVFRVRNPDGQADVTLNVLPPKPRLSVGPIPLAIPEDGSLRQLLITLSLPDVVNHPIRLSVADSDVAELQTDTVTLAAGQTETRVGITGLRNGVTRLTLSADDLETVSYSVYVSSEYGGIRSRVSELLGVMVGEAETSSTSRDFANWSDGLGVVVGAYIEGLSPSAVSVGSTDDTIRIHGGGLQNVDGLSIDPADGITVSGVAPAADGGAVAFTLNVDADATMGHRHIQLSGADAPYRPASPGVDRLNIVAPLPVIESVSPNSAVRGTALNLTLRGRNLDQTAIVEFLPPEGITVGSDITVSDNGRKVDIRLTLASDAPAGERVITVTTPAARSGTEASPGNRFHVLAGAAPSFRNLSAPSLGISVGEATDPGPVSRNLHGWSPNLGVTVGPFADQVSPQNGEIGTSLNLGIGGSGLQDVTEARFEPSTGLTVESVTPSADGRSVQVGVTIESDAPQTWRRLRLHAASGEIPFLDNRHARFLVTAPQPVLNTLTPNTLKLGDPEQTFTLRGENFERAERVDVTPAEGITVSALTVENSGRLTVRIGAATDAEPGPRVVTVTTPAGTSSTTAGIENTLKLYRQAVISPDTLTAPLLGVQVGDADTGLGETPIDGLSAPLLGISVGDAVDPETRTDHFQGAPKLGVTVGTFATEIEAPPLIAGNTYTLTVHGQGLADVDGAGLFPSDNLALSAPFASPDGSRVIVEITVPPNAVANQHELRLIAGIKPIPFADPRKALIQIATGEPDIASITPYVTSPGDTFELIVRGEHLHNASRVFAVPNDGIIWVPEITVNADGTELRTRLHVDSGATENRVIRVETPGGLSGAGAAPANTLILY